MISNDIYKFNWSDLAFSSKKPINQLKATFIAAPRELSVRRFTEIVKILLPKGNIVLGLSKEDYVSGLDGQPQFRMLDADTTKIVVDKVNESSSKNKIFTLEYFQRETSYLLEKLRFNKVLFINGSWHHSFHLQPIYYVLANNRIDYEMLSPFCDEDEAREYDKITTSEIISLTTPPEVSSIYSEAEMLQHVRDAARKSYDHTHQTGAALAVKSGKGYRLMATAYNKVVPYQTYAMHFGSLREKHFSPPNDLNHYDTVHAEVAMLIAAQSQKLELKNTTLFINLLPCPTCGRMVAETDIAEVIYQLDHSDGYTLDVLERAGKSVRRAS